MPRRSDGATANRRASLANSADSDRSPRQPATPPRQGPRNPKMAVLAAANRLRDATGTPGRNVSGTLGAAPLVVESQRYEEWMKIATDNVSRSVTPTWLPQS